MCSTLPDFLQEIDKNLSPARPSLRPVAEYKKRFNLATHRIHRNLNNLTNHHRRIHKSVHGF